MNGLLNVLKPPGMTSHDVVDVVRRLTGAKVGHTGTLDPLAAGVLVLSVGAATRLSEFLTADDKAYRAEFVLGMETDTLDLEGAVTSRKTAAHTTRAQLLDALAELTGELEMTPPMFSAVKQDGRKLYEMAREGKQVERPARQVTISRFELLDFSPQPEPRCLCVIECSKGTYVRSLAQMLGRRLGCGACLGFLLRTAQGAHTIEDSATLEELSARAANNSLNDLLIPMCEALPQLPRVAVTTAEASALRHGRAIAHDTKAAPAGLAMVTLGDEAVCLAEVGSEHGQTQLRPKRVFR